MKTTYKHLINQIAIQLALPSIIIGTLCLFVFKNSSDSGFVAIGYFLAMVISVTNGLMLLPLLINTLRRRKDLQEHLKAICLIIINIPISAIYLEIL